MCVVCVYVWSVCVFVCVCVWCVCHYAQAVEVITQVLEVLSNKLGVNEYFAAR